MNKTATFFGGAINEITPEYHESVSIGETLAERGYHVKCGGYRGLMEAVSLGVHNKKGNITGVTCATFKSTKGNQYLTNTVVAEDLFSRLRLLISDSEVFVIQRGGIGTLAELALLLDLTRKSRNGIRIFVFSKEWYNLLKCMDESSIMSTPENIIFCDGIDDFKRLL